MTLWPPEDGVPVRKKRHLKTSKKDAVLVAQVDGDDPYFVWEFEPPIEIGGLVVDVHSHKAAYLQAFWRTKACPVFRESCSLLLPMPEGTSRLEFPFAFGDPIEALRLDLASEQGLVTFTRSMHLRQSPVLTTPWSAKPGVTVETTDNGMKIVADQVDPWVVAKVPLSASWVDRVRLDAASPSGAAPKLYWQGSECEHFAERCSAVFPPGDGGAAAQELRLDAVETWQGTIRKLRLDPGHEAGTYSIRRLSFEND